MAAPATGIIPSPNAAEYAAAVTPSDSTRLVATRALYIGGAGNVTVEMAGDLQTVLFSGLTAGMVLPIRVLRVLATGTTATLITAMY